MNDWIKYCECSRYILTTDQMNKNLPCDLCQQEKRHAETFKERFKEAGESGQEVPPL